MLKLIRNHTRGPFGAVRQPSEQRRHRRHAVHLNALIYPQDVYRDLIIHDVWRNGLVGEVDIQLEPGEIIQFTLDEKTYRSGTVRSTKEYTFALDLDDPLSNNGCEPGPRDADELYSNHMSLGLQARLYTSTQPHAATVLNLSRCGMALASEAELLKGQHVLIRVGGRPLVPGTIRWARDGRIGVLTNVDLPVMEMMYSEI